MPYEQAPQMLALGDVAVSPKLSLTEGAGKLLNYMAVALPVVSFDTPVAREYLGGLGMYAAAGDVDAFAERLEYALFCEGADGQRVAERGVRLRQRALMNYRWDSVAEAIVRVYDALCNEPAPASALGQGIPSAKEEQVLLSATGSGSASPGVAQRKR
jgi:glycosyltransferase involved in cell wall biosynthesis